ncbi:MAG: hypothetical protein ACREAM_26940, partial [Blastocatellia bacterium]
MFQLTLIILSLYLITQTQSANHTTVLDDFESAESLARWRGQVELSVDHAGHGRQSLKATLFPRDIVSDKLPKDWRGHDRLLFDIYNPNSAPVLIGVRIFDELADDAAAETRSESFLADRKLPLIPGMNHVEIKLDGLEVTSASRRLALDRVRRFAISAKGLNRPATIYVDNLRLARGVEDAATASVRKPEDGAATLDSRFVTLGQAGPREAIPESEAVKQKRRTAREELQRLQQTIEAARTMGFETIYQEIPLVTAELGLDVRPLLSWFNDD